VHIHPNHRHGDVGRRGHERGAAVVEFALVVPVLLAILLMVFSGGAAYAHKISLANAAREGARYGATVPMEQCTPTTSCGGSTWAQLVRSVTVSRSDGALAAGGVCVALVSGPGTAPVAIDADHTTAGGTSPCYVDGSADDGERVQVTVTRQDRVEAVFVSRGVTLRVQATARFEG
jgi:Flp pilus assembly protein TadG